MNNLNVLSHQDAPEKSKLFLDDSVKAYGLIPNLHGVMATAPSLLKAYQTIHALFMQASFDAQEQTVVWQTINIEHDCHYCVPAHAMIAHSMKVDKALVDALREKRELPTLKLQMLRETTLKIVRQRGVLTTDEVNAFYAVGYEPQQLLEIILGLSQKVMSNYVKHLADTPIDDMIQPFV